MSITAARLQAEVGADTKGFDAGMKHADSTIAKAPSKWGKALKIGAGVGLGIGAGLVVKGITGAISAGVTSLRDTGVVVAQTESVIKSTGGAANVTASQIRDLSNATEDLTAIDDKAVQAGANMLLTFTNVKNEAGAGNDIFNQSVGILADMSTAMGTDMKGGAIQLGKALNDPLKGITALTRVGVTFSDQQKEQIENFVKAGKTAEAQKVILAELNKEFGGSGAAFAATDAGKAAKFQDAIEGIQQSIAKGLLPVVTRVQGSLTKFLSDPATMGQAAALGEAIAGIFSESNLKLAADLMTGAAGAISGAIRLFAGLPKEVQALAVGAIALKKITGIGPLDIAKGAGGLIKMVFERGATPANPLFVADVAGGIGGAAPVAGAVAAGTGLALATAVIAPASVAAVGLMIQGKIDEQGAALKTAATTFASGASNKELAAAIAGTEKQLSEMTFNTFDSKNKVVGALNELIAEQNKRAVEAKTHQAAAANADRQSNARIVSDAAGKVVAAESKLLGAAGKLDATTRSQLSGVISQARASTSRTVTASSAVAAAARQAGVQTSTALYRKKWQFRTEVNNTIISKVIVSARETSKTQTTHKKIGNVYVS